MKRYAAKLFFQFRITADGVDNLRRVCEERLVVFHAANATKALANAKKRGKAKEFSGENSEGNPGHFEFIGVMELLCLDLITDQDEVWYEIKERYQPMERKIAFIPDESQLDAIFFERESRKTKGRKP